MSSSPIQPLTCSYVTTNQQPRQTNAHGQIVIAIDLRFVEGRHMFNPIAKVVQNDITQLEIKPKNCGIWGIIKGYPAQSHLGV